MGTDIVPLRRGLYFHIQDLPPGRGGQDGKKSFIRKHYSHVQMKIDINKPLFRTTISTAEFAFEEGKKIIAQSSL